MSKHDEKHASKLSMEVLDNVAGGAVDAFLKIDCIPESAATAPSSTLTVAPAPITKPMDATSPK